MSHVAEFESETTLRPGNACPQSDGPEGFQRVAGGLAWVAFQGRSRAGDPKCRMCCSFEALKLPKPAYAGQSRVRHACPAQAPHIYNIMRHNTNERPEAHHLASTAVLLKHEKEGFFC